MIRFGLWFQLLYVNIIIPECFNNVHLRFSNIERNHAFKVGYFEVELKKKNRYK